MYSVLIAVAVSSFALHSLADDPLPSVVDNENRQLSLELQEMRSFEVRVINDAGKPIENVVINAWALRSPEGHSAWRSDGVRSKVGPKDVRTDADGCAIVDYPYYANLATEAHTINVSIRAHHPTYAFPDAFHDVSVPLNSTYQFQLKKGASVELHPNVDGQAIDTNNLYALWSDSSSFDPDFKMEKSSALIRLPPMKPGPQMVLIAKLDGDRVSHFSKIEIFDIKSASPMSLDVPLKPAKQIKGMLDSSVPRPVVQGRVQAQTISGVDYPDVKWKTWAQVDPDGSFVIDQWPQDEPIQIVALCEGYIAASGDKPSRVSDPYDRSKDKARRPQCFEAELSQIVIVMEPLIQFEICAVDLDDVDRPPEGLHIVSKPQLHWWNDFVQTYCEAGSLIHSQPLLKNRRPSLDVVSAFNPFEGVTSQDGKVALPLPTGPQRIVIDDSETYEIPNVLGNRFAIISIDAGDTKADLLIQRKRIKRD